MPDFTSYVTPDGTPAATFWKVTRGALSLKDAAGNALPGNFILHAYHIGDGCPAATPTQVTRVNPMDSTAASVNASMQAAIQSAYPGSVWQNYQLVNVVWSNTRRRSRRLVALGPLAARPPQRRSWSRGSTPAAL